MTQKEEIAKKFNLDIDSFNIGTGLIVEYEEYYLFSIQNKVKWRTENGIINVGLVGIGGGCEDDESVEDCVLRECKEEIGELLSLIDEQQTIFVSDDLSLEILQTRLETVKIAPFAITIVKNSANYNGKPYSVVFSYRAVIDHVPEIGDVFGLILCKKNCINKINLSGMVYKQWLDSECNFIISEEIPENANLIPFGTFKSFILLKRK